MKKALFLILSLILTFSLLVSCAASPDESRDSGQWAGDDMESAPEDSAVDVDRGNDMPGAGEVPDAATRQIIRNASIDLQAENVPQAYEQILALAESYGGYELQRQQRTQDDITSIDAELRLPPEHLDAFLEETEDLAEVLNTRIYTDDITAQYYDAQTRLDTMEKSLEQYYRYLEEAANIEELLSVQSYINDLTQEIESLKGRIQLWDRQLAESYVELRLRQIDDPLQVRREIDWTALSLSDMTYLIEAGIKSVLNVLIGFFQWLLIILIAGAPVWLPLLILIWIIIRRSRRRQKSKTGTGNPSAVTPSTDENDPPDSGNA